MSWNERRYRRAAARPAAGAPPLARGATRTRPRLKSRRHLDTDAEHARLAARPRERRGGRAGRRGLAARGRARLCVRLRLRGVVEHNARTRSLSLVGGAVAARTAAPAGTTQARGVHVHVTCTCTCTCTCEHVTCDM